MWEKETRERTLGILLENELMHLSDRLHLLIARPATEWALEIVVVEVDKARLGHPGPLDVLF